MYRSFKWTMENLEEALGCALLLLLEPMFFGYEAPAMQKMTFFTAERLHQIIDEFMVCRLWKVVSYKNDDVQNWKLLV